MNVGDGAIGSTGVFGASDLGSSPSPRAFGEGVRGSLSRVAGPPRRYLNQSLPSPCRLCGGPTWLQDDEGSIHPCCELWRQSGGSVDSDGLLVCPACRASEKLNREQRRRHG